VTKSIPTKTALRLTKATENQLKYWVRSELVHPQRIGKSYYYSFRDIIRLKMIVTLKIKGLSLQMIRKGLKNLSEALPESDELLSRLVIYTNGIDMIVCEKGRHFSAITRQRYLSIDTEKIQSNILELPSGSNADLGTGKILSAVLSA